MAMVNRNIQLKKMTGIALVEVTIILPVLFLLMIASAEAGRLLYSYNSLTKHSRDAARFLSTRAFTGTLDIINLTDSKLAEVKNFAVYGNAAGTGEPLVHNFQPSHVSVTSSGVYVIVQVNYPFTPIFGDTLSMFGFGDDIALNFNLNTQVTMRALD